jgi:hypothetical protein
MAQEIKKKGNHPPATLYTALDFLLVRAPLLPIESYRDVRAAPRAHNGSPTLDPVDRQVRRALAIGSPSLLEALDRTAPDDEKAARLTAKLRRFLIRMSTRPTPYGTFAGVALASWGKNTDLLLGAAPRTRTRVDMDWLVQYVMTLDAQPAIRKQLKWIANSAAWIYHDRAVLSERIPTAPVGPSGSVSIAATPVVRRAFDLARRPIRYDELVEQLTASTRSATPEKVERLLGKLGNGLL